MTVLQKELAKWNYKLLIYECGLRVLSSNVRLVTDPYSINGENESSFSIQKISERIKDIKSILGKLKKKGINFTLEEVDKNIHDVIGMRIVCLTMEDVKKVVELLIESLNKTPGFEIIDMKDYINSPKKSGYRAFHIQLKFKILYCGEEYTLNAEIQVKTVIMNAWAELEHRLRYKFYSLDNLPDDLKAEFEILKSQFDLLAHYGEVTETMIAKFIYDVEKLKSKKKTKVDKFDISKELSNDWKEREKVYQKTEDVIKAQLHLIYENNKEIMNDEGYSWIQKFVYRIKPLSSSLEKLDKKDLDFNIENIESYIHDLLGFRIVCLTQNDLYSCVDLLVNDLEKNPACELIKVKDFIKNPKESGYRGVNLQFKYKILYNGIQYEIPVEIQFRTLIMDSWADLEQNFKYKEEYSSRFDLPSDLLERLNLIKSQLHQLSDISSMLDNMASQFISKTKELPKQKNNIKK